MCRFGRKRKHSMEVLGEHRNICNPAALCRTHLGFMSCRCLGDRSSTKAMNVSGGISTLPGALYTIPARSVHSLQAWVEGRRHVPLSQTQGAMPDDIHENTVSVLKDSPCIFRARRHYAVQGSDQSPQVELQSVGEAGSKTGSQCGAEGAETFVPWPARTSPLCCYFRVHSMACFPHLHLYFPLGGRWLPG